MDLLIVLTYVALAWAVFKIFRIPVNQWTLATAALGGVFLVSGLILLMNYNHPYTFTAQKAVIAIPITPQVTGIVTEVTDKNNQLIQKGEVLFKLDPVRYQARVDRLQADLMTATHNIKTLRAQLTEAQANTTQVSAERDRLFKNYQRYLKGSQAAVNPFSERDIDDARQNFLAQDALVKGSVAEQAQIQSQLDSMVNGEQSQIVSLRAQLTEAKYNLEQTVIRAPSNGYVTQVLIRPGGSLLRPFQPCFGDAKSAAENDQLDALFVFGSLRGKGLGGTGAIGTVLAYWLLPELVANLMSFDALTINTQDKKPFCRI